MEPSFNLPGSSHDFRTVEGLSDWLVGQLAAGRTVGEVEEEFRLYLLAAFSFAERARSTLKQS